MGDVLPFRRPAAAAAASSVPASQRWAGIAERRELVTALKRFNAAAEALADAHSALGRAVEHAPAAGKRRTALVAVAGAAADTCRAVVVVADRARDVLDDSGREESGG